VSGFGLFTSWRPTRRTIRAYKACGFVEEGRMREHIWLAGRYVDNVIMGIVREEWREGKMIG
jgi:RimJ/RimL family protein N-acetyltransferase